MALADLHMTEQPAADYREPHCSGQNCPHQKKVTLARVEDDVYRNVTVIPCQHHHNTGEPAAFWARLNSDGTCPHFMEIEL